MIRPVSQADLDALYEICLRTGDAGEDATHLYSDPRLLGEIYVGPYVVLDSGLGFTVEVDGRLGGYVLGTPDTRRFEDECEERWWPRLRRRYPDPPSAPDEHLVAIIHHPPRVPDGVAIRFPAHLHIDLLPQCQGRGLGRQLIDHILTEFEASGAGGVHLGVDRRNRRAIGFYERLGFEPLSETGDGVCFGLEL